MDRAHRLGQTRAVHVYRLLTRGTLEERIMGLQARARLPPALSLRLRFGLCCTVQIKRPAEQRRRSIASPSPPQAFKLAVAATLVNADNVSLDAMDTGRLLDLFGSSADRVAPAAAAAIAPTAAEEAAAAIAAQGAEGLGPGGAPLAAGGGGDDAAAVAAQYDEQFGLEAFLARLQPRP